MISFKRFFFLKQASFCFSFFFQNPDLLPIIFLNGFGRRKDPFKGWKMVIWVEDGLLQLENNELQNTSLFCKYIGMVMGRVKSDSCRVYVSYDKQVLSGQSIYETGQNINPNLIYL